LPKDYLGFRLHGQLVTDPSDAAGTSWFAEGSRTWSESLCQISATDIAWLPEVRLWTDVAGKLLPGPAEELGIPQGIPVAVGAGDVAASAVGIGAVSAGDGFISVGTSGQLFTTTPDYRPNLSRFIHAYAHTVPDRWFQMAAMLNGARPIAWLADLLGRKIQPLLVEAEAAQPGPFFLPYLTGEKTPYGDAVIRGGFSGLGETTSQGSLMRAVVEAVAFTFADAAEAISETGTLPNSLLAIGGGTRSDFLMQTIADVTQCRLGRSDGAHIVAALGAARLARIALGEGRPSEVMTKPEVQRWFEPRTELNDQMRSRLKGYRTLYPALKSVHAALD